MAKLTNYPGSVELISGIKQKNNGDFPLLEANAIQINNDGKRLDEALIELSNIKNNDEKINTPKNSDGTISNGISGQILQTNGDGTTQWVNKPSGGSSSGTGGITEETDPTVYDWAKQPEKPTYTAEEVGAEPSGTAATKVSEHNMSNTAHDDIRALITKLETDKADKSYVVSIFEQLKELIQAGETTQAVALLDSAILDLSTLA